MKDIGYWIEEIRNKQIFVSGPHSKSEAFSLYEQMEKEGKTVALFHGLPTSILHSMGLDK